MNGVARPGPCQPLEKTKLDLCEPIANCAGSSNNLIMCIYTYFVRLLLSFMDHLVMNSLVIVFRESREEDPENSEMGNNRSSGASVKAR